MITVASCILCFNSLAIADKGRLFAYGLNSDGQLGDGSQADACEPREISLPLRDDAASVARNCVTQLAAGAHHSMALLGELLCSYVLFVKPSGEIFRGGERNLLFKAKYNYYKII
jgi:hypothetical protein